MLVDSLSLPGNAILLGVDDSTPLVRWTLTTSTAGDAQTAYELQVGTTADGSDVLATGKVASSAQEFELQVPMLSVTAYFLRVRAWDASDTVSPWKTLAFETGMFSDYDWRDAAWVGGDDSDVAPLLRKGFTITGTVQSARLVIAGAGYVDASVNGQPVSSTRVLEPGFTVYNKRVQYAVHDVTALVTSGANVLGFILGRGFYGVTTDTDWDWNSAPWHGQPRVRAVLLVTTSGGVTRLVTDSSWKTRGSHILSDSIYLGERIDSTVDIDGWDTTAMDDTAWASATLLAAPASRIQAMRQPPIIRHAPISPVSVTPMSGSRWLYDFGLCTVGWARATLNGVSGTDVRIVYGEKINPATGEPNVDNTAVVGVMQTDHVTLNGGTVEYEPRFSYKGFRFVLVEAPVAPTDVVAIPVHSDSPDSATFTSSNGMLNQLWSMARQSERINMHGIITDTPTHEKIGWLGDSNVSGMSVLTASDSHALVRKWLADMADSVDANGVLPVIVPSSGWYQAAVAPEWTSAFVLLAHKVWKLTGDTSVIGQHFSSMKAYVERWLSNPGTTEWTSVFGDWGSPLGNGNEGGKDYTATLFVILQTEAFADMCDALNVPSASYRARAADLRTAYTARLFNGMDTFKPESAYSGGYLQGPNALALAHGLVPSDKVAAVADRLASDLASRSNRINAGIFSEEVLLSTLTENGYLDVAFAMTQVTAWPSWGQWASLGATTTWNGWGDEAAQRTLSHHMHGSYAAYFLGYLAGIRIIGHGEVLIEPRFPTGLSSCAATVVTPRGPVAVAWDDSEVTVTVPPGLTAIYAGDILPAGTTTIAR